ncbi:MAG: DUF421 domain-containing protein [Actinomycetota bacterium]
MDSMFFSGWTGLFRTLVVGVLSYTTLVAILRVSGKRTLSKLNAFDLVVTIALGSTLATILLDQDVALAEGAAAFVVLIAMQFAVTWGSTRMGWMRRAITGEPCLLVYMGRFLPDALRKARLTKDEVRAAIRAAGSGSLREVEAVVLETDGAISVIAANGESDGSALVGVAGFPAGSTDR